MRLSTRGRFAINALIDLALRERASPVPLAELAQRHHISLSYLEQVFAKLRQHGLVDSTRGPGGGYTLGFRGDAITVADIVTAIEGDSDDHDATVREGATGLPDMTNALWDDLHSTLLAYMKTITLHSLAQEQRAKGFDVVQAKPAKKGVFAKVAPVAMRMPVPQSGFALAQAWGAAR